MNNIQKVRTEVYTYDIKTCSFIGIFYFISVLFIWKWDGATENLDSTSAPLKSSGKSTQLWSAFKSIKSVTKIDRKLLDALIVS